MVEENCEKRLYEEKFNKDVQNDIKDKSAEIAACTIQDEELLQMIEDAIEEAIRVMLITAKIN